MADKTADKRGSYLKADIDRLNDIAGSMIRQEESDRRSKTEHLRALRLAKDHDLFNR